MKELFKGIKGMLPGNPFKKNVEEESRKYWKEREHAFSKMRSDNKKSIEKMDQEELLARFQKNEVLIAADLKVRDGDEKKREKLRDMSGQIIERLDAEANKDFLVRLVQEGLSFRVEHSLLEASLKKISELDPSIWISFYEQYLSISTESNYSAQWSQIFVDMLWRLHDIDAEKYQLTFLSFAKLGLFSAIDHMDRQDLLHALATDDEVSAPMRMSALRRLEEVSQGELSRSGYRENNRALQSIDIQKLYQKILQERLEEEEKNPSDLYQGEWDETAVIGLDAEAKENRTLIMSFLVRRLKFLTKHLKSSDERDEKWSRAELRLLEIPIRKLLGKPDTTKNLEILLQECPESDLCEIIRLELKLQK